MNGHEKKRDYSSSILNVEQSSLTLLVFSITDGMGRECSCMSNDSEVATRGVPYEKVFLEISQNSQENTCARASFLINLQA